MNETRRFLIPHHRDEETAIGNALAFGLHLAKEKASQKLLPLLPNKSFLSKPSVVNTVGARRCKELAKTGVSSSPRSQLAVVSLRSKNRPYSHVHSGLVVCFADDQMMDHVADWGPLPFIIAVPYSKSDIERWCAAWNPLVPGSPKVERPSGLSQLAERALGKLSNVFNTKDCLTSARYRESAEAVLWHLRTAGETPSAEHVRAWAVRNGWPSRGADQLEKLVVKIANRRTAPKSAKNEWRNLMANFRRELQAR